MLISVMVKKGQITVFVIVGILILVTSLIVISLESNWFQTSFVADSARELEFNQKTHQVELMVESCIRQVAQRSIYTIGVRGGKLRLEEPFYNSSVFSANYGFYLNESRVLSLHELEGMLATMMNVHLKECLPEIFTAPPVISNDFMSQEQILRGIEIKSEEVNTTVHISEREVSFEVTWPMAVVIEGTEKHLDHFAPVMVPVKLGKLQLFVHDFVEQLVVNPYIIDAFYLLEANLSIDMSLYNQDTYVFVITDNSTLVLGQPF